MSDFVSAAEKGSKKAMNALLEANRDRAFALALLLLGDREKAADIATKVINGSWDKITVKGLYSDEAYAEYINTEVASAAALELFGTASKVFRVSKADITPRDIEKSEYEGDTEEGIAALRAALSEIPAAESFVFLLRAFGMSLSNIAKVIVQRDAAAAYFAASAEKALDGKFDIAKAESLVLQYLSSEKLPDDANNLCREAIKSRARFELPSKRAMTAIIAGVVFLALSVMAFFLARQLYLSKNPAVENEPGNGYHEATPLDEDKTYFADIKIKGYGTITVELDQKSAPNTAANFVELSEKGFYNGLTFHRIIDGFMMQGGCPDGNGSGDPGYSIKGEFSANGFEGNNILHEKGVISMARGNDYNSAGSQFFIMHEKTSSLDGSYAAFGKVVNGLEIVDNICAEAKPTDDNGTITPADQPVIESVTIRTE